MKYYSYIVDHDFGLAPNPFGGYCTLSVCKPAIRKSSKLNIGDWIFGSGSINLSRTFGRDLKNHLIFGMEVSEIIPLDDYWKDPRFQCKKPILNGSLQLMYGDNFYYKDSDGNWIQGNSAHSNADGTTNIIHLNKDTGGRNALVSKNYYYFGQLAPMLPAIFHENWCKTRGQKLLPENLGGELLDWLRQHFQYKIYSKPINWKIYDQPTLF